MCAHARASGALLFVFVFLIGWTETAHAEGPIALSLEQALERAELRSPLVRLAQKERASVSALRAGAALAVPANPVLSAIAGPRLDNSGSRPPAQGLEWGLRLEQSIEVGNQRGARLAEVERAVNVAEARERLALLETRARVRAAYVSALLATAAAEAAREREALGVRVLDSATARVRAGAAADVELHLAEVEHGRLMHERIEAELAVLDAGAALALLVDLPGTVAIVLTTPLREPAAVDESLDQLTRAARLRRQEIHALAATRSKLDAAIVRLHRELIPNPTLFVEFQRGQPGQLFVGGGVGLPLPLFRRNQGELAVARAEDARTEEEIEIMERQVESEVARSYRALHARRQELAIWDQRVLPAADRNVVLVTEGFRAGKFDLFRVVQVLREAGAARRSQLEALGALWQAAIELDRATGRP